MAFLSFVIRPLERPAQPCTRKLFVQKEDALIHLLLHCCLKDRELQDEELNTLSEILVEFRLDKTLDMQAEAAGYKGYSESIADENLYLSFLIRLIDPKNKIALFSFCLELFYSDRNITMSEEVLINKLSAALRITPTQSETVQELIMELSAVRTSGWF
jgi:uncharacterized tellurite resistance protein B-like protein